MLLDVVVLFFCKKGRSNIIFNMTQKNYKVREQDHAPCDSKSSVSDFLLTVRGQLKLPLETFIFPPENRVVIETRYDRSCRRNE